MVRDERTANPRIDGSLSEPSSSSWKVSTVVANLFLITVAGSFATVGLLLYLGAMSMLLGAFLVGPHIFQAMAILVGVGTLCWVIAAGLCMRLRTAWWIAVFSSLSICLFSVWMLTRPAAFAAVYVESTVGTSLAVFISLLYFRKYYFQCARDWWQEGI